MVAEKTILHSPSKHLRSALGDREAYNFLMAKLLIYVPTFNRPDHLAAQIEVLVPQLEENKGSARLIIADNASVFGLPENILKGLESTPSISVVQRPHNLGGNANILLGFTYLEPDEYLWILSDDTLSKSNSVRLLLSAIAKSPDLVGLRSSGENLSSEVMEWSSGTLEKVTGELPWGLISSAVYSASFFLPYSHTGFEFHNSSFPHLAILLSAFKSHESMLVVWLRSDDIHGDNVGIGATNYSLAVSGFPQLFTLVSGRERRRLMRKWLMVYSAGFAYYESSHPLNSLLTRELIRQSGVVARLLLGFGQLEVRLRESKLGERIEVFIEKRPSLLKLISKTNRLMFRR